MSVIRFDRYRDKENVPDNLVVMHGNERKSADKVSIIPEGADKPGFAVLAECLEINLKNCGDIIRNFGSDKKRIHRVLWDAPVKEEED